MKDWEIPSGLGQARLVLPRDTKGRVQRLAHAVGKQPGALIDEALTAYVEKHHPDWLCGDAAKRFAERADEISMAEADQSRYQDVCEALSQYGCAPRHDCGQDAHEVVVGLAEELRIARTRLGKIQGELMNFMVNGEQDLDDIADDEARDLVKAIHRLLDLYVKPQNADFATDLVAKEEDQMDW